MLPDESTITSVDEMIGAYKRSKWLAEQEAQKAAAVGIAGGDRQPHDSGRPGRCQTHTQGPHHCRFLEWPNARLRGYRA